MLRGMNSRKAFTLIELLIVVAIITIIVGVAVPTLVATRQATLESKAKANLRTLHSAQSAYLAKRGCYASWDQLVADGLLDSRWVSGFKEDGITYNDLGCGAS